MHAEDEMIIEATREVFTTMLGLDPSPGLPREEPIRALRDSISGMIGLSGDFRGMVAVHSPSPVAFKVAGEMLGMELTEIDADVKDAFGEIANMVAGGMKVALAGEGKKVDLSVPTIVAGASYELNCLSRARCVIIPFSVAGGEFLVEYKILANLEMT